MKYLAYLRIKVPKSPNFDLAAQRKAVKPYRPAEEFVETERKVPVIPRPKLNEAIARAKELKAVLVIPQFDRLVHTAAVTNTLQNAGIEFICLDQPTTNHNTIAILAALADDETRERSQRMKDTYARQKAEGKLLGSLRKDHWKGRKRLRGTKKAQLAAAEKRREVAYNRYQYLMPTIQGMREKGNTLDDIATWLNNNDYQTSAMKPFTETAVWRLIKRYLGDKYLGPITSRDHQFTTVSVQQRRQRRRAHE